MKIATLNSVKWNKNNICEKDLYDYEMFTKRKGSEK